MSPTNHLLKTGIRKLVFMYRAWNLEWVLFPRVTCSKLHWCSLFSMPDILISSRRKYPNSGKMSFTSISFFSAWQDVFLKWNLYWAYDGSTVWWQALGNHLYFIMGITITLLFFQTTYCCFPIMVSGPIT